MRRNHVALLVLATAPFACLSREGRVPETRQRSEVTVQDVTAGAARVGAAVERAESRRTEPGDGFLVRIPRPEAATSMVIRTAQASVEVDSLERAVAAVRALAVRVGGYVANATLQTGANQLRSGSLEVKIPAARFDEGLSGLSPIGRLESVNVAAEDVGEEFVDVQARIENARRLEARLIELIATRTGKLKDVLDVEQELGRVREVIERYEGRLRYLRAHTALSTLTVYVHEPVPVVGEAGSSVMGDAFKQAWRNFVGLAALVVQSLGFAVPLGAAGLAAWALVRRRARALHAAGA